MLIKRIAFLLVILPFCTFLSFGQNGFTISPSSFDENILDVDISDHWEDFRMESFMQNNSSDTLIIRWDKMSTENCSAKWDLLISDKKMDYLPEVTTNDIPITLLPNDAEAPFVLHVMPRNTAGCCELDIVFSDFNDPTIIYDTIHYVLKINDPMCSLTISINQKEVSSSFRLFPNPTEGKVHIESSLDFDKIDIYNNTGKLVHSNEIGNQTTVSVEHLPSGLYWLCLLNQGDVIGVQKLIKQ